MSWGTDSGHMAPAIEALYHRGMLDWNDYLRMIIGLIAIVGPFDSIPLFLVFTANTPSKRKQIARTCGLAVATILSVSVLAGSAILFAFNISIDGFRIAGGLLLMAIAFEMLQARVSRIKHTPEEDEEALGSDSIGVVPLALPLLAGPGAISSIIVFSEQSSAVVHKGILILIACLVGLLVWISFHLAPRIARRVSQSAMSITTRVMGIILAAVAVEFIVSGLINLMPGLAG